MARKSIINILEKGDIEKDLKVAYSFLLLSRGYSSQDLKILDDYVFSIKKRSSEELSDAVQEDTNLRRRKQRSIPKNLVCRTSSSETYNNRDHTLYSLNNGERVTKGRLVWSIMKLYQEEKTPVFDEVCQLINLQLKLPKNTIVDKLSLEALRPDRQKRFYYHNSDLLESKDGIYYAISNQWSIDKMDLFISFAHTMGWKVGVINE